MVRCFRCNSSWIGPTNIKQMFTHLKKVHLLLEPDITLKCVEDGCSRTFSKYNSFYRLLTSSHSDCRHVQDQAINENGDDSVESTYSRQSIDESTRPQEENIFSSKNVNAWAALFQTGSEDIRNTIAGRRHSLFGHVRRLPDDTPAHIALHTAINVRRGQKPGIEWTHPRGRSRSTWIHQLEVDQGTPARELWDTASDRRVWAALRPCAGFGG